MYILLIIIGSILIGLNYKAIKKENNSFERAIVEADNNTTEVDEKLIVMRSEFAVTITELQKEISELREEKEKIEKEKIEKVEESDEIYLNSLVNNIDNVNDTLNISKDTKKNMDTVEKIDHVEKQITKEDTGKVNSLKVDEVKELLSAGIKDDEIAQRLNIGKGEVLLIIISKIKKALDLLCDRKILFGIGLGIIMTVCFTLPIKFDNKMSAGEIEIEAKKLGMSYPDEIKINIGEDKSND